MDFIVLTDAAGNDHYVAPSLIARFTVTASGSIRLFVSGGGCITLDPSVGPDDLANLLTGAPADASKKLAGTLNPINRATQIGAV